MASSTLLASAARTASGTSGSFSLKPQVVSAQFQLKVPLAASSPADTLDVYIQSSHDGGTTWDDFVHFTQVVGDGGAKTYIAEWVRDVSPSSAMHAPNDAALAAGVTQGPVGSTYRVKYVIVDGGLHGQNFTFSVTADLYQRR